MGASEKQFSLELRMWAGLAGNALISGASESVKQKILNKKHKGWENEMSITSSSC